MDTNLLQHLPTDERILYAAMQIISQEGLKGLSASKLSQMAGIGKSTVFHHFKKMDDIPVLILEKLYTEMINPIQEDDHENISAYLRAIGVASFSDNPQHIMLYKAFLSLYEASMHDAALHGVVSNCSGEFALLLSQKMRNLSPHPIEESILSDLTNLIFMSLDGIALHYLIHGDLRKAQMAWEVLIQALVNQYHLE